ncbi:DNA polymerase III subunit [Urbifossiella limnaea]|uniref:DNA polymerase III subunit tau n=1 Tax=Urbifossiella limnaea TaxID=2528023 RepID=A0A517XZE1_9BACT|nr:DNA polymerase III subunit delta' [Urbifossiella limnaea]QDU22877.1 DNA polymerase III subunit tau [Urbifossiella limnaea]
MSWSRLRGQSAALAAFRAAAARGRLGQAYLLVGPDGVGKRLFATELARALLCEKPPAALAACDHCPSCAQVTAGTHPDVLTLSTPEGKHELPVEAMREFCTRMSLKPARGRRKVGIVLDADDFNEESANSFLKTLEEPAPGSLLLLLATGTDQQLPTVLSRCQVVRFAPLGAADQRAVLEAEGVAADQLDRLVRLGGGSAGRALALADPAVWELRKALVEGVTAPRPNFAALSEAWQAFHEDAGKDTAAQRLRASLAVGFLVEAVRHALRFSVGADDHDLDAAEADRLAAFARRVGPDRLLELIDRCVEADANVSRRVQLILIVESVLEQFTRPPAAGRG